MNRNAIAWIVLALVWLPFLVLSLYNVPIGMHEWDWMTDNVGTLPASFWGKQVVIYTEIMGRFTSNAALSLTSAWCTPEVFPFFFIAWHILWFACIAWMLRALFSSWKLVGWLLVCIQVLYLTSLHDIYDSMYRYTGVITYQFGAMLSMLAIGFFALHQRADKRKSIYGVLAVCCLVLSIGTNEITMVITALVAIIWTVLYLKPLKNKSAVLVTLAVLAIACLIVLLAPGNFARQAGEGESLGFAKGIGLTLGTTAFNWFDWLSTSMLIPVMLLSIPVITSNITAFAKFAVFNNVRLWIWILLAIVPVSMAITVFGTAGNAFPERVIDHLFFYCILASFGLLISLIVKYHQAINNVMTMHAVIARSVYMTLAIFVILHMFGKGLSVNRDKTFAGSAVERIQADSNPTKAWLALLSGEAKTYHDQATSSLASIQKCSSGTCYMFKPTVISPLLYDPLSDRRNRNGDRYLGYYYNPAISLVRYYWVEQTNNK